MNNDGNSQTIFVYETDPNAELFAPTFSEVGFGNGDYVFSESTANGRIYEWISPQNGTRQGNYEPGAFIPLPNSRLLMTVGAEGVLSTFESVKSEISISSTDRNLYSNLDDDDNVSRAYFTTIQTSGRPSFINGYQWIGNVSMEYDERNFSFIDRYRPILFDRDWNYVASEDEQSADLILFMRAGIEKDPNNIVTVSTNRRKRASFIDGWQYGATANQEVADFRLTSNHFILQNDQLDQSTKWIRSKSDISYRRWKVAPGYVYEMDENEVQRGDSVVNTLMHFKAHEVYIANTDSSNSNFRVGYQ